MRDHLRRLGHEVEIRSSVHSGVDVVHALGWRAGRSLLGAPAPWVLTPGAQLPHDAEEIAASASAVLVGSSDHATAINRLGVPNFRISVLPPAVDCETFSRLGPMANRTHRFRVVTRMSPVGDGLLRAVEALQYAPDAELIVVAPHGGHVRLPDEAERLADAHHLRSRVALVQPRDGRERAWWLRSAHAAVTLDDHAAEPEFVAEAMACGTAVVATPVDAQRELVVHGVTGFHVPVGRPRSAAGALREIFADEFSLEAYGMAGSDRALSSLDWPHVAAGFDAAYRRVVGTGTTDQGDAEDLPSLEIDASV